MVYEPQKATEILLAGLPKRSATILEKRYGLGKLGKRSTLEAIGNTYGITRERVRQIESDGMNRIRKASAYMEMQPLFLSFEAYIAEQGGIVAEDRLVAHFNINGLPAQTDASANAVRFLLSLTPRIIYRSESETLRPRWGTKNDSMDAVEQGLQRVSDSLVSQSGTISYGALSTLLRQELAGESVSTSKDEIIGAHIEISKQIGKNCFDQWGHTSSALVRPRGIRDLAYLVFSKTGTPMHFSVAAERIQEVATPRRVHAQTVHNELIKDNRFVLVGRGTYGLVEWGYEPGTVRDIISRVLTTGPRTKESIVEAVLTKRQVKENTILINLQNRKYFKKLNDGTYTSLI